MSWIGFARNSLSATASTTNGLHGEENSVTPDVDARGEYNTQQNANDAAGGAAARAHANRAAHTHGEPTRPHQEIPRDAIPDPAAAIRARSANDWADAAGSADWANRTRSAQQESAHRLPPHHKVERPARESGHQQREHAKTLLCFSRGPAQTPAPALRRMPVGLAGNPTGSAPSPRHEDEGDRTAADRQRIKTAQRRFHAAKTRRGLSRLSLVMPGDPVPRCMQAVQRDRLPERAQATRYRPTREHVLTPGPRTSRHVQLNRQAMLDARAVQWRHVSQYGVPPGPRASQRRHDRYARMVSPQDPVPERAQAIRYHGLPPQTNPDPRVPKPPQVGAYHGLPPQPIPYPRVPEHAQAIQYPRIPEHEATPAYRALRLDCLQFEVQLQNLDMLAFTCQFNCAAELRRMREQ